MRVEIEPTSIARWSKFLNISKGTLERWYYGCGMKAPATASSIRCALFYGRETCERARGATRNQALENLKKINEALEVTQCHNL